MPEHCILTKAPGEAAVLLTAVLLVRRLFEKRFFTPDQPVTDSAEEQSGVLDMNVQERWLKHVGFLKILMLE